MRVNSVFSVFEGFPTVSPVLSRHPITCKAFRSDTFAKVSRAIIPVAVVAFLIMSNASGATCNGAKANISFACTKEANWVGKRDLRAKQVNLIIRDIGHRLLLQSGDMTSRVLPVTEISQGTFLLEFEREFVFNHDSLAALTQDLLPRGQFPSGYTVTVHECITSRIVYGFQINNLQPDIMACRGRLEPPGCYSIEIAIPDLFENTEGDEVEIEKSREQRKTSNVDYRNENAKVEKVEPFKISREEGSSTVEDLIAAKTVPVKAGRRSEELQTKALEYPVIHFVYSGILVVLGVTLLIGRFGKFLKPRATNHQVQSGVTEFKPTLPSLGKFLFDAKNQKLLSENDVIALTEKECRILELLYDNLGQLVPRETLMQKIWLDQGVITGRSLDMFISKLRKKLSGDEAVKITNVHGKGYILEIQKSVFG